ncbi:MAG: hypothetical protein ABSB14_18740 [Candidatus Sulfotelmatobacter sp.]|jgi:hypothetical protein
MATLIQADSGARELLTEILEEAQWWRTLVTLVKFLDARQVETVRLEFGYVLGRDLAGHQQALDEIVQLNDLEHVIRAGFDDGTIEWNRSSDFRFYPLGIELAFMLCNDADLHFASADSALLAEVAQTLRTGGVKVYDSIGPS